MIQFTRTVSTCLACMTPWVVCPDLPKTNFCLNVVSGISKPHESEVTVQSCVITMAIMHKIITQVSLYGKGYQLHISLKSSQVKMFD